jgi:hypothetical protein
MPKTTITENERLKLIGLLTLAAQHNKAMEDIKDAALAITDERDSDGALETCGHTTDALWNDYSVDMLLRKLGMDVAPNAAPEPPCDRDLLRSLKAIVTTLTTALVIQGRGTTTSGVDERRACGRPPAWLFRGLRRKSRRPAK